MNKKYFLIILSVALALFYLFHLLTTMKLTVKFDKLEPFKHRIPVYYNGFKLGHTTKIYPDKDFKSTRVELIVQKKNLHLPLNTTATVKRKDKKDYIELEYPKAPYLEQLRNNDVIEGHAGKNLENFLQEQAQNGGFDEIKENVNQTVISAGKALDSASEMLVVITDMLKDMQPEIKDTVNNINITSKNLAESSYALKNGFDNNFVESSLYNLEQTTDNLVQTSKNITKITDNINMNSVNLINCVIKNINIVVDNINQIVVGVGETLSKKFGGLRLLFSNTLKQ